MKNKAVPHNAQMEMGVLASMLQSKGSAIDKATALPAEAFYSPRNRKLFIYLVAAHRGGMPVDLLSFQELLREEGVLDEIGGPVYLTELQTFAAPALDYYLEIVREKYAQREVLKLGQSIITGKMITVGDIRAKLHAIEQNGSPNGEKPLIEFRSPLQLKNFTPPPGIVLVGDCHIVKGSVFVIGGAPGVGKSRASVSLAVAGATCSDWFDLKVHRKLKVMIIQTENGELRLAREFGELNCEALENFVRVCPPPPYGMCFARTDFRAQLAVAIAEFKPDIVIFDPWNAVARDEKAREYLETFDDFRSVLPLGDDAPALGIVAHTRKPRQDERASGRALLNLLAGSYVLGSVPRSVFVMQAATDDTTDNRVVWTCCKNNDGELGARSAWERSNGLFAPVIDFDWQTFDAPNSDRRQTITETDVAEVFVDGPLPKTEAAKRLRENTGASKATAYRALDLNGRFRKHLRLENGLWMWK